ncbi:hypothetical protein L1887_58237 [Cichorium endivia]|nr:hypothetical protein L1887_58237 [Cichorium endivia]
MGHTALRSAPNTGHPSLSHGQSTCGREPQRDDPPPPRSIAWMQSASQTGQARRCVILPQTRHGTERHGSGSKLRKGPTRGHASSTFARRKLTPTNPHLLSDETTIPLP